MPWWGWIVVGAVLLAAELFVVPTDFFLVFLGCAAIAVGLIGFVGIALPAWGQWATFAVIALALFVFLRGWLRARFPQVTRADDTLVGEIAVAREALAAGASGQIELRGTTWSARNAGDVALVPGDRARVERVEGLTLHVRRES
jgi:membrane protein implicated in regulation of membrane protease activity